MNKEVVWIPFDVMEAFMTDVFTGLGVPRADAEICAAVLIESDKRGIDSHGVNRLKPIYYDRITQGIQEPVTHFEVVREGPTTAVVDGHNGMGHVIAKRCMNMAINKARAYGMGMVAARNSTHYGIAGYYVLMAAAADMIGITGTNARPSVTPTFGVQGMLGTNPLTFGIPSDEDFPFVLDCATSLAQRGKVELYARVGKPLPHGWIIGDDGQPRYDARQVLVELKQGKAAFVPLGGIGEETAGYKGYGYCTVVEILSAALQSGAYLQMLSGIKDGKPAPYPLGHFFIAMDIAAFVEPTEFKKTTGDILRTLRAGKRQPDEPRIYTAGEKEHLAWLDRKDKGVPVNESLQRDIRAMREELGLDAYDFPF